MARLESAKVERLLKMARLESAEKERMLELVRLEQLHVSENVAAEERKFRADQAERERELELVRLEQLRVSDAAEEWILRAEQAERDRELEIIWRDSHSGEWSRFRFFFNKLFYIFIQEIIDDRYTVEFTDNTRRCLTRANRVWVESI